MQHTHCTHPKTQNAEQNTRLLAPRHKAASVEETLTLEWMINSKHWALCWRRRNWGSRGKLPENGRGWLICMYVCVHVCACVWVCASMHVREDAQQNCNCLLKISLCLAIAGSKRTCHCMCTRLLTKPQTSYQEHLRRSHPGRHARSWGAE